MKHDPPQVLTVAAITCRQCLGVETYHDQNDRLTQCHICENGYEKVLVSAAELQMAVQVLFDRPDTLYATVVRIAEANSVRLPVLTHNTANLANHLLPVKPRIPLSVPKPTPE